MIHVQVIHENDGNTTVSLGGEITIENIGQVREALLEAVQASLHSVTVDFVPDSQVDISLIQLLCASHRSAEGLHKQITLKTPLLPALHKLAFRSGFESSAGCTAQSDKTCLWK